MRFELLHDIFLMHSKLESVIRQCIVPDLFNNGQYLQSVLLQKENPLSFMEVPNLGVVLGGFAGLGSVGVRVSPR